MSKKNRNKFKQPEQAPVEEVEEAAPVCEICGTVSPAGTIICTSCGGSLGDESELDSETEIEELPQEEDLEAEPEIQEPESIPEADEEVVSAEEIEDEESETSPLKIKMTLLLIGITFAVLGILGIIALRTGLAQEMLGYSNPSPGIGPAESMAQIVSMVPLMLGLALIGLWGIRNDPIYDKIEKLKKNAPSIKLGTFKEDEGDIPEEFIDAVEDFDELELEPEKIDELEVALDDVEVELDDIEVEEALPEESPEITSASVKDQIMEEMRVEKCEKMLSAVVVLPDDKQKLRGLIDSGVSMADFIEEVKTAVERRKKREQEKDVTADEKASILEDELVAELAELEEDLDGRKEQDLEEQILKEIDEMELL